MANFISSIRNLATSLATVNEHRYVRVDPGNQVTNTIERLDGRIADGLRFNCDFWRESTTKNSVSNRRSTNGYKSTMSGYRKALPRQVLGHDIDRANICYRV